MKNQFLILFICSCILLLSCDQKPTSKKGVDHSYPSNTNDSNIKNEIVYIEPQPTIIDPKNLEKIVARPYQISNLHSNKHPILKPTIVSLHHLRSTIDNTFSYTQPQVTKAIIKSIPAGIPEITIVKDPSTKDNNSQNFSYFNKLQGLKQSNIYSIIQDRNKNMWISSEGGGVSKYDGKYFTNYSTKNGLAGNDVRSILEDHHGNIWFGTYGNGLSRFDGKSFTNFTTQEGLSSNFIFSLIEDKSGNIWIGTENGGACKFDGTNFTNINKLQGLSSNNVLCMLEDKKGNIWFGTEMGGVSIYDGKSFNYISRKDGLQSNNIYSLLQDDLGQCWIGTEEGGVTMYNGNSLTTYKQENGFTNNSVWKIIEDRNHNLWFCTDFGVCEYNKQEFIHFTEEEGISSNFILCALEDYDGTLWFGTSGGGINKFSGYLFTHLTKKEGLPSNLILNIFQTKNGNIWLSTEGEGFCVFDGNTFTNYRISDNRSINIINCIYEDHLGNIWFGSSGNGLYKYDGSYFSHYDMKDGLTDNIITCITEDKNNNLWIGTEDGGACKLNGNTITAYTDSNGLSNNDVRTILEDKNGTLWFGTYGGGITKYDGQHFYYYTTKDGLSNNIVWSIQEDKYGYLWIGTSGSGINRFDGKEFIHYTEKDGLCNNVILCLLNDKYDNLWIGTRFGLSKLSANNIENIHKNKNYRSSTLFKNYGFEDGFLGLGCNGNSICETADGKIWFGTNDRLTILHPQNKSENKKIISSNIQLIDIKLFNENIDWKKLNKSDNQENSTFINSLQLSNGVIIKNVYFDSMRKWNNIPENLSLAYDNNYLSISFLQVSTNDTKNIKYKYKLEGNDNHWSTLSSISEANYGNLSPGTYTFKVQSLNGDGSWSKELNYKFTIRPPWWKTNLFKIIVGLFSLSSLIYYIKWRERALKARQYILEKTVNERTAELVIEKKKSDDLLLNILPEEVAEELKLNGNANAKEFDEVTVMFTDFKGFTQISEKLSPEELVAEIHTCFKAFDEIITSHNIEKIKTIGDSYMCAGGLPIKNKTHAIDVVNAAIEIQQFMLNHLQLRKNEGKEVFEIRIGIHTGTVVAGIVGVKKFAYDIWGDTVNTASRLESSGEPGKINISSTTYEIIKDKYKCTYRGKINAKNKGEIDMYFVDV